MDTAQTRWTARHKQHIGQEACFFGNRLPASFYNPAQPPVAPCVADKADTADIPRTPPEKKELCKPANAEIKDNRITYGESRPMHLRSSDA